MSGNRNQGGSRGSGGRSSRGGQQGRGGRSSGSGRQQGRSSNRQQGQSRGRGDRAPERSYIEGRRAVEEALRAGYPVKRALVAKGLEKDADIMRLVERLQAAGVAVNWVPRARLDELSSHGAHQGIVLEAEPFHYADLSDVIRAAGTGPALVVVLDHVTDEGNFGAIVRSAEVVGAAGVVIASDRSAQVGVGAFKTSAGAVMHLPIAQVTNLPRAIDELKGEGFWVGGASEHAEDVCWDTPLEGRIALVMGSEGEGLSRLVREKCDFLVKLPQRGQTESLNVAQAASVLCYEWLRCNRQVLLPTEGAAGAGEELVGSDSELELDEDDFSFEDFAFEEGSEASETDAGDALEGDAWIEAALGELGASAPEDAGEGASA